MDYGSEEEEVESEDGSNVGRGRKRNSSVATMDTVNKRPRLPTREPEIMDFAPIDLDILGDPLLDDVAADPVQPEAEDDEIDLPFPDFEESSSYE